MSKAESLRLEAKQQSDSTLFPSTVPSTTVKRLGRISSLRKEANGIVASTKEGHLLIKIYSESVVRVTIANSPDIESYPYAVVAKPGAAKVVIEEQQNQVRISTSRLKIIISRGEATVSFLTSDGLPLNEEDSGLGTSWIGEQLTTYRKLQPGERFIGLGEKTGPLDRRGLGYQNWNTDAFSYSLGEDPLYCSTPFYIGIHQGRQYGVFLDNTYKSFFNFGASNNRFSSIAVDAGDLNYYFIQGDSVAEIISHYTWLTGRMPLPPKWSIGYQQCRYSYYPDSEVRAVARTFREKNIPADGIVLDIHYMDQYKIFTWDKKNFPDPPGLIQYLKSLGFEVVLMCDPGIKVEPGYEPYDNGCEEDIFLKYPDETNYTGQVWPGWCHFPDFTNPKARTWWKEKLKDYTALGVEGYWNDMNEIATWGHMLPENIVFHHEGEQTTSRKGRNVYGFQMARSTYEAAKELLENKRPFNLSRSGFSGVQRYAAVWTGDNVSYDDHMLLGVRMVNSLGLAGIPFVGYDVAGFTGEASVKLYARWITVGALSPFFRGHTMVNSPNAEPWAYGEEVENIARNFIRLRYQLMPYLYSVFEEASRTGMPVQRSMAVSHPHESWVYDTAFQNQYLFGPHILVAPVVSHQSYTKVYFPEGQWYSIYDGSRLEGGHPLLVESPLHRLPIYIRAGAVIPMQRPVMHTREEVRELILHVYAGEGETQFDFYDDDGATFDFEKGAFCRRVLEHSGRTLIIGKQEGNLRVAFETIRIILHGMTDVKQMSVNGKVSHVTPSRHSFFIPLEKYDPLEDPDSMGEEEVVELVIPWSTGQIEATY